MIMCLGFAAYLGFFQVAPHANADEWNQATFWLVSFGIVGWLALKFAGFAEEKKKEKEKETE